jgi:hypothetical protein
MQEQKEQRKAKEREVKKQKQEARRKEQMQKLELLSEEEREKSKQQAQVMHNIGCRNSCRDLNSSSSCYILILETSNAGPQSVHG